MRKEFIGYYPPSKSELDDIWKECVFIFDTNVLLNLYRYTKSTQDSFIKLLSLLKERIWIPHQVASEFFCNRIEVIASQSRAYDEISNIVNISKMCNELQKFRKHLTIDINSLEEVLKKADEQIKAILDKAKKNHPDYMEEDAILNHLLDLFDGKVGAPYDDAELKKLYDIAQKRFEKKIPPGYKDIKKEGEKKYNDYIVWSQILEYSKKDKTPIILVTDDRKEDWWYEYQGKTIGPRPELLNEIYKVSEVMLYMYKPDRFMELAQDYTSIGEQKEAVKELKVTEPLDISDSPETTQMKIEKLKKAYNEYIRQHGLNNKSNYNSNAVINLDNDENLTMFERLKFEMSNSNKFAIDILVEWFYRNYIKLNLIEYDTMEGKYAYKNGEPVDIELILARKFPGATYEMIQKAQDILTLKGTEFVEGNMY